jgi:hypothetical protein
VYSSTNALNELTLTPGELINALNLAKLLYNAGARGSSAKTANIVVDDYGGTGAVRLKFVGGLYTGYDTNTSGTNT